MRRSPQSEPRRVFPLRALLILTFAWLAASAVQAAPYHSPAVDGFITADGTDWFADDLVHDDFGDYESSLFNANVRDLWMTWDETHLTLGLRYQAPNKSVLIYLDNGLGAGPSDADLLGAMPRMILMPEDFSIGMMVGRTHTGFSDTTGSATVWRVTDGTGTVEPIAGVDNQDATYSDSTLLGEQRFGLWFAAETRIPWTEVWPDGVPANATLKAVAAVTLVDDHAGAEDVLPGDGRTSGQTPPIAVEAYHMSIVDQDGDGVVDPLDAAVSGSLALSDGRTDVDVTVTTMMQDWTGGSPTGFAYVHDFPVANGDYAQGRLAAGSYELTFSAPGYFSETLTATVAAGEIQTGRDVLLQKATTITGTLDTELHDDQIGSFWFDYRFYHPDGTLLDSGVHIHDNNLDPTYPLTFYVSDSGTYVLEAWADYHLRTEFEIEVTAGEDVSGLAFVIPRAPLISGSVAYQSGPGADGTVAIVDPASGEALETADVSPSAPGFSFYAPALGDFELRAVADTYLETALPIEVAAGVDQTDLLLSLARMPELALTVLFLDGPGNDGEFTAAGSAVGDTLTFTAAGGAVGPVFLPPGEYDLTVDAPGYDLWSSTANLSDPDAVYDIGTVALSAVRADRLRLLDAAGLPVESLSGTVSIPDSNFFSYAPMNVEAVGPDGRRDLFDLDGKLTGLPLTARKMNDVALPSGFARFLASEDVEDVITTLDFADGTANMWMADDAVEVLRVFVGPEVPDPLTDGVTPPTGRFMIGFRPPEPETVVLTATRDSLTADDVDQVVIVAQLYDSAGNTSPLPDHPMTFLFTDATTGVGAFEQATVTTNADGLATAVLTATGAGVLHVTAAVTVDNAALDVRLETSDGESGPLVVRSLAGPTAAWSFDRVPRLTSLSAPVSVAAVLVDAFGNPTGESGVTAELAVAPEGFGSFADAAPVTDDDGRVTGVFTPSGLAGLATMTVDGASLEGDAHDLQVRDVMLVSDPPSSQEPDGHASFDAVDLTTVIVENTLDDLSITIPFSTTFENMILHVLLETQADAAGAPRDPFEQPVNYGHDLRPDYAITAKLGWDSNYTDLRRWGPESGIYEWWDADGETWIPTDGTWVEGIKLQDRWVFQDTDGVTLSLPWTPFGGVPDSVRVEVYVSQELGDGTKRAAFDSAPQDATLDLDFDYTDPGPGDWEATELPVTLSAWSDPYPVRSAFPDPPTVTSVTVEPDTLAAGTPFTVTARATDAGGGVGDVIADLSPLGGGSLTRMHDDGLASHGDAQAGDGVYSVRSVVPLGAPGGDQEITVSAYDAGNVIAASGSAVVLVEAEIDVIVHVDDELGDDRGPARDGVEGMDYTYPTNSVFVTGAFDIEALDVYETTAVVNGQLVEMIAFAVSIGDFPDPADPTTADWSPFYGDMNIQKIDILLDTGPGGATRGLPNRRVDVEPWNAWDYAVIMDGWYKALVPSFGQNTIESWRENALKTDSDIQILGDFDADVVTALVSKEALGNPTAEDVAGWGMAVLMSSHDFGGEEVLGGIRWVNESLSEWNFGGGHYTDRDPNIIDLLVIPGAGRQPGRTQQEILDYETDRAVARLERGETPCALEMSKQVDTGPPVIRIERNKGEVVQRLPLADAPIAFSVEIEDDTGVQDAVFRYRDASDAAEGWTFEVPMGYAGDGLWTVDLPQAWVDTALVSSPIDGARYVEFEIEARDYGTDEDEPKVAVSPVTTLQLDPAVDTLWIQEPMDAGDTVLRHVDGSVLRVPDALRWELLVAGAARHPGGIDADSLATVASLGWEIGQPAASIRNAPAVPAGTPLDAFRSVSLDMGDDQWSTVLDGRLPRTFDLTLHYLQDVVPEGADEQKIGLYEYHAANGRWVLVGGNVNASGNLVTASVDHEGVYGLFWTPELAYDPGEVISGITVSPSPFSPNGDGLFDQTTISFFLTQEATVTVEVYNIDGRIKRRLMQTFPFGGDATGGAAPNRSSGLIWDGTDENGKFVPYGIYVLRLIVTYNQAGGQRTIRSNHPVAVIR